MEIHIFLISQPQHTPYRSGKHPAQTAFLHQSEKVSLCRKPSFIFSSAVLQRGSVQSPGAFYLWTLCWCYLPKVYTSSSLSALSSIPVFSYLSHSEGHSELRKSWQPLPLSALLSIPRSPTVISAMSMHRSPELCIAFVMSLHSLCISWCFQFQRVGNQENVLSLDVPNSSSWLDSNYEFL